MDKLQQLMKEKQSVEAELQRCQEAEREATEQVRRSEPSLPVCCMYNIFVCSAAIAMTTETL